MVSYDTRTRNFLANVNVSILTSNLTAVYLLTDTVCRTLENL